MVTKFGGTCSHEGGAPPSSLELEFIVSIEGNNVKVRIPLRQCSNAAIYIRLHSMFTLSLDFSTQGKNKPVHK